VKLTGLQLAGSNAAIELVDYSRYVGAGFVVGRDAVILVNRSGASVVCGESQRDVVVVSHEQIIQVSGAAADIFIGSEAVVDAQFGGCPGHELHEAASACAADRMSVAVAFSLDHAGQ